ncbi:MAG TPA: tat pathway signal sequence, partial [Hyphomicrobium sp.]|nr:tat pathway signal sequence [Hyphomicrobium sp.]
LVSGAANAAPIDPKQTFVLQHGDIEFEPWTGLPPGSGEMAKLYGDFNDAGPYLVLMKWNPGWFSAPHSYATDRIQMVLSGTWWVNSGADFTP